MAKHYIFHNLSISTTSTEEDIKKSGIYLLRCKPTNKVYVGQTRRSFITRWLEHQGCLIKNVYDSYIQRSFNKYGIDKFEFVIVEFLPDNLQEICNKRKCASKEQVKCLVDWLNEHEHKWVVHYRNELGYKSVFNADDGGGGINPTSELRKLRSQNSKIINANPEVKAKIKTSLAKYWGDPIHHEIHSQRMKEVFSKPGASEKRSKYLSGTKKSEAWKEKMRESTKRRFDKLEERKKISDAMKRHYTNPEARKKASEIQRNRVLSSEAMKRIREAHVGTHHTQEMRNHLSNVGKSKWMDVDYRLMQCKARGTDPQIMYLDFILYNAYQYMPELKRMRVKNKLELIQYISTRYDNQHK